MNAATTRGKNTKAESGKLKAENFGGESPDPRFAEILRRSRIVHAADRVDRFERLAVQGLSVLFQLGEKVEELSGAGAALVGPTDPQVSLAYDGAVNPARFAETLGSALVEGKGKVTVHAVKPASPAKGGQA